MPEPITPNTFAHTMNREPELQIILDICIYIYIKKISFFLSFHKSVQFPILLELNGRNEIQEQMHS